MNFKISIIVPCYNEQDSVPIFYNEITRVLSDLKCDYEICFINDGSTDGILDILRQISDKNKNANYISFSRNFGKEAAMYAGFCNANGDYVCVMDADMQDPPGIFYLI